MAFWATWCPPCLHELPRLQAVQRRFADDDGVAVVAVSVDRDAAAPRRLIADEQLTVPLVTGGLLLYARFFPRAGAHVEVPRTIVIDRRGRGLVSFGFDEDESADDYVRGLAAVIARVRAGKLASPPAGWRALAGPVVKTRP